MNRQPASRIKNLEKDSGEVLDDAWQLLLLNEEL